VRRGRQLIERIEGLLLRFEHDARDLRRGA
jgi:hypothetical protein